jgi:hypothetical protein
VHVKKHSCYLAAVEILADEGESVGCKLVHENAPVRSTIELFVRVGLVEGFNGGEGPTAALDHEFQGYLFMPGSHHRNAIVRKPHYLGLILSLLVCEIRSQVFLELY